MHAGKTGHAEVVKIEFDSSEISYDQLLEVFFSAHDPTTLNKQGSDVGSQYRSVILYTSEEQEREVVAYIKKIDENTFKAISTGFTNNVMKRIICTYKLKEENNILRPETISWEYM